MRRASVRAAQASVAALRQYFAAECADLEGSLMLSELDGTADVGPCVDNAGPAVLMLRIINDDTRELILAPADWQAFCMLHSKKKGY